MAPAVGRRRGRALSLRRRLPVKRIAATFDHGVLRPSEPLDLPEGAEVSLLLECPTPSRGPAGGTPRAPDAPPPTATTAEAGARLRALFPDSFGGFDACAAREIERAIADEFDRIDPDDWR